MNTVDKIHLFRDTFHGRRDMVPRYWKSKDGQRIGYTPLCRNEWEKGLCQKPCRTCANADYIPLSNPLILDHFKGNHILGVYPLLKGNVCHFIAADFDNHNADREPLIDVKGLYEVCQVQEIPCYVLRSKSGQGFHVYIFFNEPIPAWKARAVCFAMLQEAQVIGDNIELLTFDRLFPNQDRLTGKEFGNLIALPYQGQAVKEGHTLLLDPETGFSEPYQDQYNVLANIQRIGESQLDELIGKWKLTERPQSIVNHKDAGQVVDIIMECNFIKWCRDKPSEVSEPLWFALISNLVCVRPGGYSLCHKLSKGHPGYNRSETDRKVLHSIDGPGPHTCEYINSNGFNCRGACSVNAPAALCFNNNQNGDPQNAKRIKVSFG